MAASKIKFGRSRAQGGRRRSTDYIRGVLLLHLPRRAAAAFSIAGNAAAITCHLVGRARSLQEGKPLHPPTRCGEVEAFLNEPIKWSAPRNGGIAEISIVHAKGISRDVQRSEDRPGRQGWIGAGLHAAGTPPRVRALSAEPGNAAAFLLVAYAAQRFVEAYDDPAFDARMRPARSGRSSNGSSTRWRGLESGSAETRSRQLNAVAARNRRLNGRQDSRWSRRSALGRAEEAGHALTRSTARLSRWPATARASSGAASNRPVDRQIGCHRQERDTGIQPVRSREKGLRPRARTGAMALELRDQSERHQRRGGAGGMRAGSSPSPCSRRCVSTGMAQ